MALTTTQKTEAYQFFIVAFDAVTGVEYMSQLNDAYVAGMTTKQIVNVYTTKPQFEAQYPRFLSNEQFADKLIENVVGASATDAAKLEAKADVAAALNAGWTKGDVVFQIFTNLAAKAPTDVQWGATSTMLANKVAVAEYVTETLLVNTTDLTKLSALLDDVTQDAASVDAAKAAASGANGQIFPLTTGADAGAAFTGTAGNDTFTAGETGNVKTLTAGDNLNGGAGVDTLNVSAASAQNYAGFTTAGVEVINAISDAAQVFDLSGTTGLTTVKSSNSANATTFNEVTNLVDVEVVNLTNTNGVSNVTVQFQAAAVAGTTDAIKLTLNDGNAQNITIGNTANAIAGVETINLVATGANSTVNQLNTNLSTLNVAGEKSVTITTALNATVTKVDASAQTAGGIDIKLTNAGNVAVTGGAGNDKVTFTGALTSADSFNGGAGRDTIVANLAELTGGAYAVASKISNVETLEVADSLTTAFDAAKFTGDDTVVLAAGFANATSVTGMESGYTLQVRGANAGNTLTAAITNATSPSTNDTLNLQIGQATTVAATDRAVNAGTIATTGIEHLTVLSNGTLAAGTNAVVLSDTTATTASVTDVVITGANGITVSSANTGAASITSIDASAATGNVNMNALAVKASGANIKGGSGADVISGGAGADTIVAGAGNDTINGTVGADNITLGDGADKVVYTAATQSTTNSGVDTINDFVSGTDAFDISALLAATPGSFKGNQDTFSASQNSVVAGDGVLDVVFQKDEKVLWIDMNDDGLLNAADFRISLPGVATLTATDVGLNATGNSITLTAPAAVVNTTTNTNATAKTTVYADTISSTAANLVGSTINGSTSTDTLTVTDAIGATALNGILTSVEVVNLAAGSTAVVTAQTYAANTNATVAINNTSATAASFVTLSTLNNVSATDTNRQSFTSTGTGVDTVVAGTTAGATYSQSVNLGAGADFLTVGGTHLGTLAGGDGADTLTIGAAADIKGATVSGFETLAVGAALTLTAAQYAGFTTAVTDAGTNAITFSDAAAVSDLAASTANTYVLADGQSFTGNAAVAYGITTANNATNETVTIKAGWTAAADVFNLGAGTGDTVNIAYNVAGNIDTATTANAFQGVENLIISAAQTPAFTLTLDAELLTVDASAAVANTTVVATNAAQTSLKLGAGNDTITTLTANTVAAVVELGAGNDTITALNVGAGALTVDSGSGNLTVANIVANGAGVFTLKFGAPVAGTTASASVTTTGANFKAGDIFDFASNVTSVITGQANGTLGVAGAVGQVFVDSVTNVANTIITFDADGSRTFSAGDVQITIVGNVVTGGIDASGNFLIGASA